MTATNNLTLKQIARAVEARFVQCDAAEKQAYDHRYQIGVLLIQARERCKADKLKFEAWYKENIKRSKADIYRCIKLAEAEDPAAAREAEKEASRTSSAATRERVRSSRASPAQETAALAAVQAAQPNPPSGVWDRIVSNLKPGQPAPASGPTGQPASAGRDQAISASAAALSSLTGTKLARAVEDEIRLLTDVKWSTLSDARRLEIGRLIDKLAAVVKPASEERRAA